MLYFFSQYADWGWFFLRFAVAAVFIYHGLPKLKNPKMVSNMLGMPGIGPVPGIIQGLVEVLSGLALIFGMYLQQAALLLALIMLGAIYFKKFKWKTSFSMSDKTGWEFDFTLLAANLYILTNS